MNLMSQKGIAPIVIVLLIAAAIGGYLIYSGKINLKQNEVRCTEEAKICPDGSSVGRVIPKCEFASCPSGSAETANWKTYTNDTYGYIVKYPSDWEYKFGKGKDAQVVFGLSPVEIRTDIPNFLISVSETIKQPLFEEDGRNKVMETKQITIGGQSGEQATIADGGSGKVSYIQSAVLYNGKTYYFNLHDLNKKEIYDQILSTFKFLD